jgi:uncharacterized protein (TIGR00255 family)
MAMIKGMTGFGAAQIATKQYTAIVEIKSVNHRYLDINYYLPSGFGSMEEKIRQAFQKALARGRITVSIKLVQRTSQKVTVNKEVVRNYVRQTKALKKEFNLKGDILITDIIKFQGVWETKDVTTNPKRIFLDIEKAFKQALNGLILMRKREGQSLSKDINKQLKDMAVQIKKISARSKSILRVKKKQLTNEEFSSFQKANDVNEEIARLIHYVGEIKALLNSSAPAGKKVDFIGQEMQRETNTIGSKMQDKTVSNAVISLKSKVEKVREQAQNAE